MKQTMVIQMNNELCPFCNQYVLDEDDENGTIGENNRRETIFYNSHFECFEKEVHLGNVYDMKWRDERLFDRLHSHKEILWI